MKKSIKVSFLWHMHQPDYRNSDGLITMPWVFLHAIKDYYDMPWILSKFPDQKATFNLTPSLIEQLKLYADPLKHDYFLQLWSKPANELSSQQRDWMIKICKSPNFDTMIKPMVHYSKLSRLNSFNDEELNDLQIQFILAWCGNYLRKNNEVVKKMLTKAQNYSFDDKVVLLEELRGFVETILPFYKSLLEKEVISISTTPYFHPILPLLIDMDNIQKANPHTKTPQNPLSFKDDAIEHVKRAKKLYKETFGAEPVGFWPAEGAVDEKSVEIYKNEEIKWIATDEAILYKSLQSSDGVNIHKPYTHNGVLIAFRDRGMSDLLGFEYKFRDTASSVEHFISSIEPMATENSDDTLFIILDGENAWEFYKDNAYPFFMQLYEKLSNTSWCTTTRMDDLVDKKRIELEHLSSGSWINGDFSTWSGHPEKNRAWELLFQTRRDVDNYAYKISDKNAKKIQDHFLAAQCSDWFWWYGDDHFTDFAVEFDELFRRHLISIYDILDMQPPADLFKPIIEHKSTASFMVRPHAPIYPKIDGRSSSFFEWIGCGVIDETRLFSTMDKARGPVEKIRYGHNESMVYVAFYGDMKKMCKNKCVLKIIIEELSKTLDLPLDESEHPFGILMSTGSSFEIALPKTIFGEKQSIHLRFELEQDDKIIQTLPGFGALEVQLNEDYSKSWFV